MQVTKLPQNTGPAGWAALLPDAPVTQPLAGAQTADWVVIGAGITGLAAAHRLAQLNPGDRITVLEAGLVAEGPAGRNSGFMIDLPHDLSSENYGGDLSHDRAQIAANRLAISFAQEMVDAYALPPEAFTLSGKVNGAATARGLAHNDAYARHLTALGEPFEMRDAADMRALTGSHHYQGGLFTPGTAMVQPALYVRGIAQGLQSNRVVLCERSPVTALREASDIWEVTTPSGSICAPRVVLAVNGHAESFGLFKRQLVHVHLYASLTRALTEDEVRRLGGAPTWGLTPADPLGTTVRRINGTGGARLLIRNRCHYTPGLSTTDAKLVEAARTHDQSFADRFPQLAGVEMEYRWAGALCLSLNDASAWGEVAPGLFAACCQNGLGLTRGTLSGMAIAERASGQDGGAAQAFSDHPHPKRLPPSPLDSLGATARLRWGEWRAGAEL